MTQTLLTKAEQNYSRARPKKIMTENDTDVQNVTIFGENLMICDSVSITILYDHHICVELVQLIIPLNLCSFQQFWFQY